MFELATAAQMKRMDQRAIQDRGIPSTVLMERAAPGDFIGHRRFDGGRRPRKGEAPVSPHGTGRGAHRRGGIPLYPEWAGTGQDRRRIFRAGQQRRGRRGRGRVAEEGGVDSALLPGGEAGENDGGQPGDGAPPERTGRCLGGLHPRRWGTGGLYPRGGHHRGRPVRRRTQLPSAGAWGKCCKAYEPVGCQGGVRRHPLRGGDGYWTYPRGCGEGGRHRHLLHGQARPVRGQGALRAGKVVVHDIGIPEDILGGETFDTHVIDGGLVRSWLPRRPADGHKGDFGRVLVVGGSTGYTGAPVLCARGALRSRRGAGEPGGAGDDLPHHRGQVRRGHAHPPCPPGKTAG